MRIVIDTNIWVKAFVEKELELDCIEAFSMFSVDDSMVLSLDDKGEILREYRDNIKNNRRFELEWKKLGQRNRLWYTTSKLDRRIIERLDELDFQEAEDRIFVGVALHSDKVIVTEDSDYGAKGEEDYKRVFEYMRDMLGLRVYSSNKFCEEQRKENDLE